MRWQNDIVISFYLVFTSTQIWFPYHLYNLCFLSTEYFRKLLANGNKTVLVNPILWTRRKDDFVKVWLSSDLSVDIIWIHLLRLKSNETKPDMDRGWTSANIQFPNCNPTVHLDWKHYVWDLSLLSNKRAKYQTIRQSVGRAGECRATTGNWGEERERSGSGGFKHQNWFSSNV